MSYYDTCPHCEGRGKIYYLWDKEKQEDIRVPFAEYKKHEASPDAIFEPCPHCDSNGEILVDDEEDYYDDDTD